MVLLQKLNAVLKKEYEYYQQLYDVAKEKKKTLIANDSEKILELISEDDKLIREIEEMEEERKKIVTEVRKKFDINNNNLSYSQMIDKLPEEWKKKLSSIRAELLILIDKFHIQNVQNRNLLKEALKLNKFSLDIILNKLDISNGIYNKNNNRNISYLLDKKG